MNFQKEEIEEIVLKSEKPLSASEICDRSSMNIITTRNNLRRLQEEGKIFKIMRKSNLDKNRYFKK